MSDLTNPLSTEERLFLAYCHIEKSTANKKLLNTFYDLFNEDYINIMFKEIDIIELLSYKNKPRLLFRHIKKTLKKASFFTIYYLHGIV